MGWTSFYVTFDSASLTYEQKNTRNEANCFLWKFTEIFLPFSSIPQQQFHICCCWEHEGRIPYKPQVWRQLLATIYKRVKEMSNSRCTILTWLWTAIDTEYFLLECSGSLEIQVSYRGARAEYANRKCKLKMKKKKHEVLVWSSYTLVFVCQIYFNLLSFR